MTVHVNPMITTPQAMHFPEVLRLQSGASLRDYTLASMKNVVRAKVNEGAPLTEQQNAEVTKQAEQIKAINA